MPHKNVRLGKKRFETKEFEKGRPQEGTVPNKVGFEERIKGEKGSANALPNQWQPQTFADVQRSTVFFVVS